MGNNTELAACPFCGGDAQYWEVSEDGAHDCVVECRKCACRTSSHSNKIEAVAYWNTRALHQPDTSTKGGEVVGYLFDLRYGLDHWSKQRMFAQSIAGYPAGDLRNVQPLYATPVTSSEAAIIERCAKVAASHVLENVQVSFEAGYSKAAQRIVEEIRALAPLPAASREGEGVEVKALEWSTYTDDGIPYWKAPKPFGSIYIIAEIEDHFDWKGERFPTLEAAKGACQADYETRIRSALVQSTSPEAAGSEAQIEAAARGILQARFGDDAAAFYAPVPDDFPRAAEARALFAKRVTEAREEAVGALAAVAALSASEPHAPTDHDYAKALTIKSHGTWIDLATLLWWRQLVDANPADLAPRIDKRIEDCLGYNHLSLDALTEAAEAKVATLVQRSIGTDAMLELLDVATFAPWLRNWVKKRFGKWITHNTAIGALNDLRARSALTKATTP